MVSITSKELRIVNTNVSIEINEINKLILEISDCKDNIKSIFNKINDLMDETENYYSSYAASKLRSKYKLFNDNYKVILSNISSYANDFQSLKKKYVLGMDAVSEKFLAEARKIDPQFYKERR